MPSTAKKNVPLPELDTVERALGLIKAMNDERREQFLTSLADLLNAELDERAERVRPKG